LVEEYKPEIVLKNRFISCLMSNSSKLYKFLNKNS
jgi:hypothetical protein